MEHNSLKQLAFFMLVGSLALCAACSSMPELPEKDLDFGIHIMPLIKNDCALCHYRGEYYIALTGKDIEQDYFAVTRYIDLQTPEQSMFLRWASGYKWHPVLWAKDSAAYKAVKTWIAEGAKMNLQQATENTADGGIIDNTAPDQNQPDHKMSEISQVDYAQPEAQDHAESEQQVPEPELIETTPPEPEEPQISFTKQIVPYLRSGCARCHYGGRFNVNISGFPSDYSEVMRYVDIQRPEAYGGFLWWCADAPSHRFWSRNGSEYQTTLKWIQQGAKNN